MPIALTAYALTLIVALTSLVLLYRAGMLSAVAMLLYLCVLLLIRPLMLFSGLDVPQPANAFDDVALDAALALLAALLWTGLFTLCALAMRAYLPGWAQHFFPARSAPPTPRVCACSRRGWHCSQARSRRGSSFSRGRPVPLSTG